MRIIHYEGESPKIIEVILAENIRRKDDDRPCLSFVTPYMGIGGYVGNCVCIYECADESERRKIFEKLAEDGVYRFSRNDTIDFYTSLDRTQYKEET